LILRLHASRRGEQRARHEYEIPRRLCELGFPVPRPLLLQSTPKIFDTPFLIMEEVEGPLLIQAALRRPWRLLFVAREMADTQVRLHTLSPDGFPGAKVPFLQSQFRNMLHLLKEHPMPGLAPGMKWLWANRPAEPETPSVIHLDFHPLNLIKRADGELSVLDWTYSEVGDLHADVATTLLLMECYTAPSINLIERLGIWIGRPLMCHWYLKAYCRRLHLDLYRLNYYRAWAALSRLISYQDARERGSEAIDRKPAFFDHLTPKLMSGLCSYFHRWTGVTVSV
jgi:aminoglycoside phosphotransferase (APT) family kinase protein